MDSDHAKTSLFVRLALKALAGVVMLCSAPVMMLLWGLKAIFHILTWPIRIPWRVGMWCLEMTMELVEEYSHFFLYFTCAIATGAATGILVAIFTELVTTWLPQLLPFLRRRPHPAKHRAAQQTTTTTTATAAATAATTKPRRPAPRHVASAVYWSSDEEADGLDRHVTFIPPSRRHGYSPKKPLPPSSAGPSTTSSSAWSTSSSSRGSRHRAPQQPVKARVAVADIIHEESSVSERELPVLRSSTRGR